MDDEVALATAIARSQCRRSEPPVPDSAPDAAEAEAATEAEAEVEAQPQQPEGQPSSSSPRGLLCSCCQGCTGSQPLPKAAFSKSQASKPAHKRRCKQCVAAGAMSSPWLQAPEVTPQPEPDSLAAAPGAAAASFAGADGRGVRGEAERLFDMAWQHCQQCRPEAGRPLFERALEVDPRHMESLSVLGFLHFQQGRLDEARPLWERALEVNPRHVKSLYSLGLLHFKQCRPDKARSLWERALVVNPEDQRIQSALARLTPPQLSMPEPQPPQTARFPARTVVVMRGLSTRPELNGRRGVVRSFDADRGRCGPSRLQFVPAFDEFRIQLMF